jgi:hypothetical protein
MPIIRKKITLKKQVKKIEAQGSKAVKIISNHYQKKHLILDMFLKHMIIYYHYFW